MAKIEKAWFTDSRIFILTDSGEEKSRPLEAFPLLKDADDAQRNAFYVWAEGESIRWDEIDEDIHISSFYEDVEPNFDNVVAKMIDAVGVLNLHSFAEMIGMSKSKLDLYRYGIWKPSEKSLNLIKDGLRQVSNRIAVLV